MKRVHAVLSLIGIAATFAFATAIIGLLLLKVINLLAVALFEPGDRAGSAGVIALIFAVMAAVASAVRWATEGRQS